MASWTNPTIASVGAILPSTSYNAVANNTTFLYQAPSAAIYDTAGTSIANNTVTQVALGGTTFLKYGFTVGSNNLIVPLAGVYQITGAVLDGQSTSFLLAIVKQNGANCLVGGHGPGTTDGASSVATGLVTCAASDTIGLWAYQVTGGSVTLNAIASQTFLHAVFLGSN